MDRRDYLFSGYIQGYTKALFDVQKLVGIVKGAGTKITNKNIDSLLNTIIENRETVREDVYGDYYLGYNVKDKKFFIRKQYRR